MGHAVVVRCPNCSANLKVDPTADTAVCSYCGATALVPRGGGGGGQAPAPSSKAPILAVAGIVLAALLAAVGFFFTIKTRPTPVVAPPRPPVTPERPPPAEAPSVPAPAPEVQPEPAPIAVTGFVSGRAPMLADVDGDGDTDVVALAELRELGERRSAYAFLDLETGALIGRVAPGERPMAAVAHGRLLVHSGKGQVDGYELPSGKPQWTTALGDQGLAFCASRQPDAVEVMTADGRVLALDAKTGRQSPARATGRCAPLPTDERRLDRDPRDRADPRAPAGVTAWKCGTVTVMGSANYTVPDSCKARAKVDPDAFEGIVLHAVWQADGGWLAFGVRNPGTHSPIVALLRSGRLVWKADVVDGNPLDAEGGPSPVALVGERVLAGYRTKEGPQLTAFALADGKRLWRVALAEAAEGAVVAGDRVLLHGGGRLTLIDAATGSTVRTLP